MQDNLIAVDVTFRTIPFSKLRRKTNVELVQNKNEANIADGNLDVPPSPDQKRENVK